MNNISSKCQIGPYCSHQRLNPSRTQKLSDAGRD